jgi:hypothetical protein
MTAPALVISLDTELAWGAQGLESTLGLSSDGTNEREKVDSLLKLFSEYDARVTWAIVGHLFFEGCNGDHPELEGNNYPPNWWTSDPGTDVDRDPLRYAPDLVDKILSAPNRHEIGSHTFSHSLWGHGPINATTIKAELALTNKVANRSGISIESITFPQNRIGNIRNMTDIAPFIYRGTSVETEMRNSKRYGRLKKFLRYLKREPAPIVEPQKEYEDIWNLPASMNWAYSNHPIGNSVSDLTEPNIRVTRAKKALDKISQSGGILHIWAHPYDFGKNRLADLSQVLEYAEMKRIPVIPMQDAVQKAKTVN